MLLILSREINFGIYIYLVSENAAPTGLEGCCLRYFFFPNVETSSKESVLFLPSLAAVWEVGDGRSEV